MSRNVLLIFVITGFAIVAIAGYYVGKKSATGESQADQMTETRSSSGYSFINPLLECDNFKPSKFVSLVLLEKELKNYIAQSESSGSTSHISIYFRALNNGPWIGINENENYAPASLLKVPILIAVLKKAQFQPSLLEKKIMYDKRLDLDFVANIQDTVIELGKSYSIEELAFRMIKYSDNEAKELLVNETGEDFIAQVMEEIGVNLKGAEESEDFVSVKTYSSFFRLLYNATYINRNMSEKALTILSSTRFDMGIPSGIPGKITISHKFGERGLKESNVKQLHDCGIVYQPGMPYLLCIMTRGNDFNAMSRAIADISSIVNKHVMQASVHGEFTN